MEYFTENSTLVVQNSRTPYYADNYYVKKGKLLTEI